MNGKQTAIEQKVLNSIDTDGLLAYLCELVSVPSLTGEATAAQEHVAAQMKAIGLELDVWELDFEKLSQHPAYCVEVDRTHGLGVVGRMGAGNGGRDLIFNGHVDVVPTGDPANWHYPPWQGTVSNGRVYGRGALDMKGGLVCALFAAKAIRDAGVELEGKLMIESVIGEEDGGVGTLATVLRGYKADGAVVVEPTNLVIAPAQAGALNFRVMIPGLSAHGALRNEGTSAIEKFPQIYRAIMALEKERNQRWQDPLFVDYPIPYPICIGTMQAGDWASSVADWLTFEGRYGVTVGENLDSAKQMLADCIAQAAQADPWLREHPPRLEWWGGQFAPASIPADHAIVKTVGEGLTAVSNTPPHIQGMPYGADMRLLVNQANTPTVLFGPGDVRHAHRPDEFVPVADLITVTQTLAVTALRFCGYK